MTCHQMMMLAETESAIQLAIVDPTWQRMTTARAFLEKAQEIMAIDGDKFRDSVLRIHAAYSNRRPH